MTHYDVLGVGERATTDEIRRAYRRRARDHHPDANPADPAAGERFRRVAEAYEVLSDPVRRSWYDATVGVARPRDGAAYGGAYGEPAAAPDPPAPDAPAAEPAAPPPDAPPARASGDEVADRILQVVFTLPLAFVPGLGVVPRLVLLVAGWFAAGYLLHRHAAARAVAFPWWRSPGWAGTGRLVRVGAVLAGLVAAGAVLVPLTNRVRDAVDAQGLVEDAVEDTAPTAAVVRARAARDDAVDAARDELWRIPAAGALSVAAWVGSARLPALFRFPDRRRRNE
jgi:DnaJ domain